MASDAATKPQKPTPEEVRTVARVFGVPVDEPDLRRIADELGVQLAACEQLDEVDLDGVDPASTFDARWR